VRNHYHVLKYKGQKYDILCPGYNLADIGYVVIIPWYLIPGRPYPVQVYQFACSYYSMNPNAGQREAAKVTRDKFGLKTFSHSTVSRSFKSFEYAQNKALKNSYGEEIEIINSGEELIVVTPASKDTTKCAEEGEEEFADLSEDSHTERRFPSVSDTANRRNLMMSFLPKFQNDSKLATIESVGREFVLNWHEKYRRLLL
jgi:hypothetical protein